MIITVIREDDDIIVVDKPAGMPSAPLKKHAYGQQRADSQSALEEICVLCPAVRSVSGRNEWEAGLVHRLDTDTRGLLLAAKNQRAYDFLQNEQESGRFEKHYRALVTSSRIQRQGFPPCPCHNGNGQIVCESKFRAWGRKGKEVRPVAGRETNQQTKQTYAEKKAAPRTYTTTIFFSEIYQENLSGIIKNYTPIIADCPLTLETLRTCLKNRTVFCADCAICRGFRHQVRVHLAWLGFPVIGDPVYGYMPEPVEYAEIPAIIQPPMMFFSVGLRFRHPSAEDGGVMRVDL
ncbi:MAG: pseudouridine synthase [Treponemataceae bacterium]|nr:MAG: pseudouridine synthase [Treponemataceae bacterium]